MQFRVIVVSDQQTNTHKQTRLANSGFGHSGTPSPPFPSLPLPLLPFLLFPSLPPSRSQWAPPLNQLGGLGSDVSSPSGSGAKPQPTNDLVHISEPKGAALVATVFVHFHHRRQPHRGCRGRIPTNVLVGGGINGNVPTNIRGGNVVEYELLIASVKRKQR